MKVEVLKREDAAAEFTCIGNNNNDTQPVTNTVKISLNCKFFIIFLFIIYYSFFNKEIGRGWGVNPGSLGHYMVCIIVPNVILPNVILLYSILPNLFLFLFINYFIIKKLAMAGV